MLNYQLQIVGDEFVTSIGHDDEFHVNLLFDRSIYRPMCTHTGSNTTMQHVALRLNQQLVKVKPFHLRQTPIARK